jgi:acetylornithine deacetylase/succinyl-diaminopimelate desuccinylase family protein
MMERHALEYDLIALLADLVAIPSTYPPGDVTRIGRHCANFLSSLGYSADVSDGNVVARLGRAKPSVVFNAHADTVDVAERGAWRTDPFKATLVDGRIYGLGACNCKGAMAVHLWLAREIARRGGPRRGEVVFTFVGDDENLGPNGLSRLRQTGAVKPDTLVVAAPTRNGLVLEERGVMWVRVTARGKAAHGGAPHTGDSAILRVMKIIAELERIPARRSPTGHESTLSVGRIYGGENTNVVPDLCTIEIDHRILPEEDFDAAFARLESTARAAGAASVELITGTSGFRTPEHGAGVDAFSAAIRAVTGSEPRRLKAIGASDARYFARDAIDIVVTGPGDGADSHKPNEFVPVEEMVDAALIHWAAAERLLALA